MKLWGWWREPRHLLPDEEKLLDLLLADGGRDLQVLRRQWSDPFFIWVERQRRPERFELCLVYDGAARDEYIPGSGSIRIDDLHIELTGVRGTCQVVGDVHEGVLGNVWILASHGKVPSWPRRLELQSWSYADESGASRPTRTRSYSVVGPPIEHVVADLESRIGQTLPPEYRDFVLAGSKPRRHRGAVMLRASQVYRLDEPPAVGPTLAIGSFDDGFALGLRLSDGVVVEFDVDARPYDAAPSFGAWLRRRKRRQGRSKGRGTAGGRNG